MTKEIFAALLPAFNEYKAHVTLKTQNEFKKVCKAHGVSFAQFMSYRKEHC